MSLTNAASENAPAGDGDRVLLGRVRQDSDAAATIDERKMHNIADVADSLETAPTVPHRARDSVWHRVCESLDVNPSTLS